MSWQFWKSSRPATLPKSTDGTAEMVSIPRTEYDCRRAAAEGLADLQAYDRTKAALASGEEERIAADYANRLLNGDNALRV